MAGGLGAPGQRGMRPRLLSVAHGQDPPRSGPGLLWASVQALVLQRPDCGDGCWHQLWDRQCDQRWNRLRPDVT